MVSADSMCYCGYTLGHHSVSGPLVRLTRIAVDNETAMESKFASRYGLNCSIVPKTTADVSSSSSMWPGITEYAELGSSTAHDQLAGLPHPTAFHETSRDIQIRISTDKNRRFARVQEMLVPVASRLYNWSKCGVSKIVMGLSSSRKVARS